MARYQKNASLPVRSVTAPSALIPLMEAFHAKSDMEMRVLILESAKIIYGPRVLNEELKGVISLVNAIHPRDTLETLYAAQFVLCHILGMRKLAEPYADDRKLGLNLLFFCNDAMQQLEKKLSKRD